MSLERHMKVISPNADDIEVDTLPLRIAVATSDLAHVDEHFGSASRLAYYEVGAKGHRFVGVCEFTEVRRDGNENKLPAKLEALRQQHGVIALEIGNSAVRQLIAAGVQPVKLGERSVIEEVLDFLSQQITLGEAPWIQRAITHDSLTLSQLESELEDSWIE